MATISKTQVNATFKLFCKVYGLRTEGTPVEGTKGIVYEKPFIHMEYWQGYRIQIINPDTSESYFNNMNGRKTAREMYQFLQGLLAAKIEDNFIKIQL